MADARPHRPQGGLTLPGGYRATLPTVGYPGRDWVAQDSPHAGGIPTRFAHGRGKLCVTQPFGDALQRGGRLRLGIPGKDLGDHRRFDRVEP